MRSLRWKLYRRIRHEHVADTPESRMPTADRETLVCKRCGLVMGRAIVIRATSFTDAMQQVREQVLLEMQGLGHCWHAPEWACCRCDVKRTPESESELCPRVA